MSSKLSNASELASRAVRRWHGLIQPSAAVLKASKTLFEKEARLEWSAASIEQVPQGSLPEISFLGSSNVGKSTLLNLLFNRTRHKLVRTSSKPGSTQTLKGFNLARTLVCVDSPGYGYRSRSEWGDLILRFIKRRSTLRRTCLLIEASKRIKSNDEELITQLAHTGVPFQIVLTKSDKLKGEELQNAMEETQKRLDKIGRGAVWPEIIATSNSAQDPGITALRASLYEAVGLGQEKVKTSELSKLDDSTTKIA